MDWLQSKARSWSAAVVKSGGVPRHIAIIMDGNRRYARQQHLERIEGHVRGFDKLKETLEWCLELGVNMVSVYAFSIENFKRSEDEVEGLMRLAEDKFRQLLEKTELIHKHQVSVRVLGNISLLPVGLQRVLGKAVHVSRYHNRAILNVCFAYTARDDIACAMSALNEGAAQGLIQASDITPELLSKSLYTEDAPDPELLVRSSGEVRLSDFLLWQSAYSALVFTPVLWPDFSFWHLLAGVLRYQWNRTAAENLRKQEEERSNAQMIALDEATATSEGLVLEIEKAARVAELQQARRIRQEVYLANLHAQRAANFARLAAEEDARNSA